MPTDADNLTPEQAAVVAHDRGPALVYAVAGAGKTTSMVHRIERLVREGVFAADRVLATSFGRSNADDLRRDLAPWPHCAPVDVRTLHSLGRQFIVWAQQAGHYPSLRLNQNGNGSDPTHGLFYRSLAIARAQGAAYAGELDGLDRDDFLDFVDRCKGNLAYADLEGAGLPPAALEKAVQAEAPTDLPWYLDLYRLFERVRLEQGVVTFSDMLLTGWEALVRYPEVLARAQRSYDCVLVDEFQDINLAQAEMLDLITAPHRNYMAIGDDDQTIYEWRGASPDFILGFAERYGARRYFISENFRCPAGPLVLANAAIRHNRRRQAKQLRLTRGLGGRTEVRAVDGPQAAANAVLAEVLALQQRGASLNELAVLVRLNAQTAYIEQTLISNDVPYRYSDRFFDRPEVKTLIAYARLAWYERELRAGRNPFTVPARIAAFTEDWGAACNRPTRYLRNVLRDKVAERVVLSGQPLTTVLALSAEENSRLADLADDLDWLADHLNENAHTVLETLDERLGYQAYLQRSSGSAETGAGRAATVAAFIEFARGQGSLPEFLSQVKRLSDESRNGDGEVSEAVTLSTIHQAKGREWPIVVVPDGNEGVLPFRNDNLEEERRLFYVAVTRSRRDLLLLHDRNKATSRFLTECGHTLALPVLQAVRRALSVPPERLTVAEVIALTQGVTGLGLGSYFGSWWQAASARRQALAREVQRFLLAAERYGLSAYLGLKPKLLSPWREIAPVSASEAAAFPLERLLPQPVKHLETLRVLAARGEAAVLEAVLRWVPSGALTKDAAAEIARAGGAEAAAWLKARPEPLARELLALLKVEPRVGTWVRCDAGWGLITRMEGAASVGEAAAGKLHVRLRPASSAEKVVLDLEARTVTFPGVAQVYTCGTCGHFASADADAVLKRHSRAAHGAVGKAIRARPGGEVHWKWGPEYYREAPEDEWA